MIAGAINGANHRLGKPSDMTDAECHPLAVRVERVQYADGETLEFTSAWYPTPDELKRLNEGAAVYLTIVGQGHPPVRLSVGESVL
jgi:hypothetical protein